MGPLIGKHVDWFGGAQSADVILVGKCLAKANQELEHAINLRK